MQTPYKVWRQNYIPQKFLTKVCGMLSHCSIGWFKNWAIPYFINRYHVNLNEALDPNPQHYRTFHDFFIRKLDFKNRPIDFSSNIVCSPCDGVISQMGNIEKGKLIQAKDRAFHLADLVGDPNIASEFHNGRFMTIYLAPKDYHRVHMPCDGTLQKLSYFPGKLFSVNPLTAQYVDNLFAQNERAMALFKNDHGSFAMLLVGAMIVGNIFVSWHGYLKPKNNDLLTIEYPQSLQQHIILNKGIEMGYFSLGSTVILLFSEDLHWDPQLSQNSQILVGQRIGRY